MKIFDTLSQRKTLLKKPAKGAVKLFVCGPTVYDYSHIGHARTYLVFDAFVKYLRSQKKKVFYLQNITDIDDKIINRAKEQKINPLKLANKFKKEYFRDLKTLKINSVDRYAQASKFIPEIVNQIQRLIKKGHAYKIEGDGYYFNVATFPEYGKLSKRTAEQANDAVSRIDESIGKINKADFALWKFGHAKSAPPPSSGNPPKRTGSVRAGANAPMRIVNDEPLWNTPLGWGRPGWHIEDTAITENFFGPQYDIHGGGIDLKFPHHEAEIAQQEACSGKKPLVKIWMHTGFLLVEEEKMSKSLGNFITIKDYLKKHSPETLRLMVFSNHYRSPFDYSESLAQQTENSLNTIRDFIAKLNFVEKANSKSHPPAGGTNHKVKIQAYEQAFKNALNDDFNTPKAIAEIFKLISNIQPQIWQLSPKDAKNIVDFIAKKLEIFEIEMKTAKIPAKIAALSKKRELYRKNKQFIQADRLRKEIDMLGYVIEDTPLGPMVRKS